MYCVLSPSPPSTKFRSNSGEPNPIPSADGGPNSLIGSSHQPTTNGKIGSPQIPDLIQLLNVASPGSHLLASSTTSTYNPGHFPAQYQTQMAGTSNGVMNCVYNQYTGQQTGWPENGNVQEYFAPIQPPVPRHVHNSRHGRHHSSSSNTSSNSSAYGAPTGNNEHDRNEKNVQEPVPIEVRRSVDMADFEVLEKGYLEKGHRGRGDSRYPPSERLAHLRSTAVVLGTLFVVVSSLFGWQRKSASSFFLPISQRGEWHY